MVFEDDPPRSDSFPQDVEARATWNDSFPAGRRTQAKVPPVLFVVCNCLGQTLFGVCLCSQGLL